MVSTCDNTSNYMNDKSNFETFQLLSNTSNYMNDKCNLDIFEIKGNNMVWVCCSTNPLPFLRCPDALMVSFQPRFLKVRCHVLFYPLQMLFVHSVPPPPFRRRVLLASFSFHVL